MLLITVIAALFVQILAQMNWGPLFVQPQQIHLSLGANESQMIVKWVTFDLAETPTVRYGVEKLDDKTTGSTKMFVDGGPKRRVLYIHTVVLKHLQPATKYKYVCGSTDGWSGIYWFKTLKTDQNWSPKLAVYGDLGNKNGRSTGRLQQEANKGIYDAVIHVGDLAYDLATDNARVGDQFMRQIEPIAAVVPYQVLPGNHEHDYNYSNYDNRFTMVSSGSGMQNNHFWSYDLGAAHFIAFSTEFYHIPRYGTHQLIRQFKWLESDLKKANSTANRKKRPWILAMGHRPLYAQSYVDKLLIKGFDFKKGKGPEYGLENLFKKYQVDLVIAGHMHNYERTWPIFDNKLKKGSDAQPYRNAKAPVYLITGAAGNLENQTKVHAKRPHFSAYATEDYGYTRMTVYNGTHLYWEQVSENKGGRVIDKVLMIKNRPWN